MKKKTLLALAAILIIAASAVISVESYTAAPSFCGTRCHIMDKPYKSWLGDKHGKAGKDEVRCVDCHYAPGEKLTLHAKFKGLGQLFTYLSSNEKEVRKATHIADVSCSTEKCHPREQFMEKKLAYGKDKKVGFTHRAHYEKTISGQEMHCTTCHIKASDERHFEVPKEQCYICHFRKSGFNTGRSACALCHEIPATPLQQQKKDAVSAPDEQVITHQSLEKAGVTCQSCHFRLIRGETALMPRACETCHSDSEALSKKFNMQLMHAKHVADQKARCADCHQPLRHKEGDFIEAARLDCGGCHPDHHSYQKALLAGAALGNVPETPALMNPARTNCHGCHTKEERHKGETLLRGDVGACVKCHSPDHEKMLSEWQKEIQREVDQATRDMDRALKLMQLAGSQLSDEQRANFTAWIEESRETLKIVEFGKGTHNKKYAVMLIDEAMNKVFDVLDVVEPLTEGQPEAENANQ